VKVTIYIHPGIGRTGTTLLQKTIEQNTDFLYFGRGAINRNAYIKELLDELFYKHKHPYILKEIGVNANPQNLDVLMEDLAIALFEEWKTFYKAKELDHTKLIISDEYIFYTPERLIHENFDIISFVVKRLEHHIKDFLPSNNILFNRIMTVTIRNQADLIHSIWMNEHLRSCYSWFKKEEFKLYDNILDFDHIIQTLSFNQDWNLNIVPFEILKKKGIDVYVSEVFPGLQIKSINKNFQPNKSNLINGVFCSKFFPTSRIVSIKMHHFMYKRKISRKKISILNIIPQKFFEILFHLIYPIENKFSKEMEVQIDKVFMSQIRNKYSNSNKRLSEKFKLDLHELGY